MKPLRLAALCSALFLAACGTLSQEQLDAKRLIEQVELAFQKDDLIAAGKAIDTAGDSLSGSITIPALFTKHPEWLAAYRNYLTREVDIPVGAATAQVQRERLAALRKMRIYPDAHLDQLEARFSATLLAAQQSGMLAPILSDPISAHPALQALPIQQDIFARTMQQIRRKPSSLRPLAQLAAYAARPDVPDADRKQVEEILWRLNVKRSELPLLAGSMATFAIEREKQLSIKVELNMKTPRVAQADVINAVGDGHGISWRGQGKGSPVVTVTDVRYVRTDQPLETQRVTYGTEQIDKPLADYATFAYMATSKRSDLVYLFEIETTLDGQLIRRERVGATLSSFQRKCYGAQVWTPLGGTAGADFTANADMKRRCNDDPSLERMFDKHASSQIAEAILRVPPIHEISMQQ